MENKGIKELVKRAKTSVETGAKKAKASAEAGAKKVEEAAKKVTANVNEGLDVAIENQKRVALAKNALKELQTGIKELEKENKAKTEGNIKEDTNAVIKQLKDLAEIVKNNPENCDEAIDALIAVFRASISALLEKDVVGQELNNIQIMSTRYEDAFRICLRVKAAIEEDRKKAEKSHE